jgi:predicted GTPase
MEAPKADNTPTEEDSPDYNKYKIDLGKWKDINEINNKLATDYYDKDNPFKKVIIGSSVGIVGSYSTAIIALGMSGAYISGGILFYDTAFVVAGWGTILGTVGLFVGIPSILGGIGYAIYKVVKTKKMKNYMKKIGDKQDDSMDEERDILPLITKECLLYFKMKILDSFNGIKKDIKDDADYIIKKIRQKVNVNIDDKKNQIKKEINDMSYINILLIGNTGVGKSTLINEFLQLKNNKAEEGNTSDPQKIDKWPKKYPVNVNDTNIKGINLFDTEGIEKCGENDYNKHLEKIIQFIHSDDTEIKEKMNAIWYCINSNRLDGDENYINKILELFVESKIPIIFIFTKAYQSRDDDIEVIYEGLKNFYYFKKNPNELKFVEIIAKDKYNRKGELVEKKKGLNTLLEETRNISKKTIMVPIIKSISDIFNKSSLELLKKLTKELQEQYESIIVKHDKFKTFKMKLYNIFKCIYGDKVDEMKYEIEKKIDKWMEKLEEIKKKDLKNAIKEYDDKNYLINKIEVELKNKYDKKIEKNKNLPDDRKYKKNFKDFKEDIIDYLITPINTSKEIYALYTLFDLARDLMLEEIIKDLEINLNTEKKLVTELLYTDIINKIKEIESILGQ